MAYEIVEKKDQNSVHAIFDYRERAEKHLKETIPFYVAMGFFMNKSLTADDFEIKEC